jgi:hypothetical protein
MRAGGVGELAVAPGEKYKRPVAIEGMFVHRSHEPDESEIAREHDEIRGN